MIDFVFIDSGVGGIPYMMKLLEKNKEASCVYVADTANFPYGEKSHAQVIECVVELVGKICKRFNPKVIVVACNTMSVNALEEVRHAFPQIQFVGTVPAIKLAASVSENKRIGLLATKATCENPYNIELKNKYASDCTLVNRADPELISFIEHNAFTASREECLKAIEPAVDFFTREKCDVIILGCTHFLNFTEIFKAACEPQMRVVDSVDGVVRHALEVLNQNPENIQIEKKETGLVYVTSLSDNQEKAQYKALCTRFGLTFAGIMTEL